MAQGDWAANMAFWRFINNPRVTTDKLIEGWSQQTAATASGRHVLSIQDTSEIKFHTREGHRRGLGKVGKGNARGVLLHAMIAVNADSGVCLGLTGGEVWTRKRKKIAHEKRALADKESERWVTTAAQGCEVLAAARMITVINDREGEFFAHWALTPGDNVHLLTRAMHDHALADGGTLYEAVERARFCDEAVIDLPQRVDRRARQARLSMRMGTVTIKRPQRPGVKDLPKGVEVSFVEVVERRPPKGAEPIHWLLLTTHPIATTADAWRVVSWYKQRWIIEQLFRSLKSQGLRIEDSLLDSAEGLIKLVAIATRVACVVIQLVQARNGGEELPAEFVFTPDEIEALRAINKTLKGRTELQKNHHRPNTMAWAAWIIAKLGGWTGYASHRPPGPITFHMGMARFQLLVYGAQTV
ncbi:IS4 family transposase [Bradyrhizobium sp.]|uniref:IS4 family transposase n=1 Tax=Bradyrhizobium sp. TaxID=376 RepID=UPI0026049BB8|nr:IS4 family transposase [Bradyrhizobium sp.]